MSNENGGTSGFLVFLVFIAVLTLVAAVSGLFAGLFLFSTELVWCDILGSSICEALIT